MRDRSEEMKEKIYVASAVFHTLRNGRSMLSFEELKEFLGQHDLPVPSGWSDQTGWRWAEALAAVKKEETARAINAAPPYIAFSLDESTDMASALFINVCPSDSTRPSYDPHVNFEEVN